MLFSKKKEEKEGGRKDKGEMGKERKENMAILGGKMKGWFVSVTLSRIEITKRYLDPCLLHVLLSNRGSLA